MFSVGGHAHIVTTGGSSGCAHLIMTGGTGGHAHVVTTGGTGGHAHVVTTGGRGGHANLIVVSIDIIIAGEGVIFHGIIVSCCCNNGANINPL